MVFFFFFFCFVIFFVCVLDCGVEGCVIYDNGGDVASKGRGERERRFQSESKGRGGVHECPDSTRLLYF